jgi:hypothetical protein
VGLPHHGKFEVDISHMVITATKIIGSTVGSRREAKEALSFVASGKVKLQYEVRPMSEIVQVYHDIEEGKVGLVKPCGDVRAGWLMQSLIHDYRSRGRLSWRLINREVGLDM